MPAKPQDFINENPAPKGYANSKRVPGLELRKRLLELHFYTTATDLN